MATDPVLFALLADPDPVTRLIAADRAEERGLNGLAVLLRAACHPELTTNGLDVPDTPGTPFGRHAVLKHWLDGLSPVNGPNLGLIVPVGPYGCVYYTHCTGQWHVRRHDEPASLPPGLEAAVLAVLTQRLAKGGC